MWGTACWGQSMLEAEFSAPLATLHCLGGANCMHPSSFNIFQHFHIKPSQSPTHECRQNAFVQIIFASLCQYLLLMDRIKSVMAHSRPFDKLPTEIIRRIAASGPYASLLSLLLTNRKVYDACDDWTVYKSVIENHSVRGREWIETVILPSHKGIWARYALADMLAWEFMTYTLNAPRENMSKWAPMLIASHRTSSYFRPGHQLSSVDPLLDFKNVKRLSKDLRGLEDLTEALLPLQFCVTACSMFHQNHERDFDSDTNRTSLYASLLGYSSEEESSLELSTVLSNLERFPQSAFPHDLHDPTIPLTRLLSLAYKALPLIYYELIIAIVNNTIYAPIWPTYLPGTQIPFPPQPARPPNHYPPTAMQIPFQSLLNMSLPFSSEDERSFSTAHLPKMTDPSFLSEGTWAGYSLSVFQNGVPRIGKFDTPLSEIKFETRASPNDANILDIWSEKICDGIGALFRFRGTLRRDSGRMTLTQCCVQPYIDITLEVVMTPFGIVGSWINGQWLWLWKSEWCENAL